MLESLNDFANEYIYHSFLSAILIVCTTIWLYSYEKKALSLLPDQGKLSRYTEKLFRLMVVVVVVLYFTNIALDTWLIDTWDTWNYRDFRVYTISILWYCIIFLWPIFLLVNCIGLGMSLYKKDKASVRIHLLRLGLLFILLLTAFNTAKYIVQDI
jgi:hypothetical protein